MTRRSAAKAKAFTRLARRRALTAALAAGRLRVPSVELLVPVWPQSGFDRSGRPRPLVSRSQLDELLVGQQHERRAAVRRQLALGRELGAVCAMPYCSMSVWGAAAASWTPGYCLTHAPDEVAIERAMAGDHTVTLYPHERREAIRRLACRGNTDEVIAERLGVWTRSVQRVRTEHGIPPGTTTNPLREDLAS